MIMWQLVGKPRKQSIYSQPGIKMDILALVSILMVILLCSINDEYALAHSQSRSLSVLHLSTITTLIELNEMHRML